MFRIFEIKKKRFKILILILITGLTSCFLLKSVENKVYLGNFEEYNYDFLESIRHNPDKDFYYNIPFEIKYYGINPYPLDTIEKKEYSWLRNPENLIIFFNTVKSIGLSKFVSAEQYNNQKFDWCCGSQWENKTLNEIVKHFLQSDTISNKNDYYTKFWNRRRKENNLRETFDIFRQIDCFYNNKCLTENLTKIDTLLQNLLSYDINLANSDSALYQEVALSYFDYLKSIKLQYSAYKLIFHNKRINLSKKEKDSFLQTLNYDTISKGEWENMNDNYNGWITSRYYLDPDRYYGP
jgi:hypothetical protein